MEDEISPRCKTTLLPGSGHLDCAQKPHVHPSLTAAHGMFNSWPHSCAHSSTACPATSTCSGLTPLPEPLRAAGSSLHTLPLLQVPSGATQALQAEGPKSLGWPPRRGARSHGAQPMFNNPAFTWKWKQVNVCSFITTVLELGKAFSEFQQELLKYTHWNLGMPGLFAMVLLRKKTVKNKKGAFPFFKKWLNKCD